MSRDRSDDNVYFERSALVEDLIIEAAVKKREKLIKQHERDKVNRLRMIRMLNSIAMIEGLAGLLVRKLEEDIDLQTATVWITEQAEHIEAILEAIAREEAGDE